MIEEGKILWLVLSHPLRGTGRGSIICGRSVHNQRIERFWRDLFIGCVSLFYHLFYHMEDAGILNSDDPIHIWCLHYIYLPYINSSLANFVDGWSFHPMSSQNGLSPRQLWMQGMLQHYNSGHTITEEVYGGQADNYVSSFIIIILNMSNIKFIAWREPHFNHCDVFILHTRHNSENSSYTRFKHGLVKILCFL